MIMASLLMLTLSLGIGGVGLWLIWRGWTLKESAAFGFFAWERTTVADFIRLYGRWPTRIGLIGFGLVFFVMALGMAIWAVDSASPYGLQLSLGFMLVAGLPFLGLLVMGAGAHMLWASIRNPDPYFEIAAYQQYWLSWFGRTGTRTVMFISGLFIVLVGALFPIGSYAALTVPAQPQTFEEFTDTRMRIQGIAPADSAGRNWNESRRGVYEVDQQVTPPRLPDQIHIQGSHLGPKQWLTALDSDYHFATPPAFDGERKANGMTWKLYTTTIPGSNEVEGNTVDIALAEADSLTEPLTLLVLLITVPSVHDSLYETLFLPIVDALVPLR